MSRAVVRGRRIPSGEGLQGEYPKWGGTNSESPVDRPYGDRVYIRNKILINNPLSFESSFQSKWRRFLDPTSPGEATFAPWSWSLFAVVLCPLPAHPPWSPSRPRQLGAGRRHGQLGGVGGAGQPPPLGSGRAGIRSRGPLLRSWWKKTPNKPGIGRLVHVRQVAEVPVAKEVFKAFSKGGAIHGGDMGAPVTSHPRPIPWDEPHHPRPSIWDSHPTSSKTRLRPRGSLSPPS